jgi:hypothetical protein
LAGDAYPARALLQPDGVDRGAENKPEKRPLNYFSSISAQKSHVKPQNHLTRYTATTSVWHFSYLQSAILKQDRKKAPGKPGAFSFKPQACTGKSGRRSFV